MPGYRAYIDKKIVTDDDDVESGGDHARTIDREMNGLTDEEVKTHFEALLEPDEAIGQIQEIEAYDGIEAG